MKKYFIVFLLLILLYPTSSFLYKEKILKVEYSEYSIYGKDFVNKDLGTLYASDKYSYYKTDFIRNNNTKSTDPDIVVVDSRKDNLFSEILIDRKKCILTERMFENLFLKNFFSVYESQPKMNWKFLNQKKKINNYLCKNAQTYFRGRVYEVWYTEELPISLGPWKFNGLPGLILSAYDKEGVYKWEVKNIQYPYKGKEIDFNSTIKDNPKFKKKSYKDFDKKRIDAIKNKIELIKSRNANRDGMKFGYEYSTFLEKEPVNEWRSQKDFK